MVLPRGYIRLDSQVPRLSLQLLLDESIPHITEGYGGWQDVTRPRRRALSRFVSLPTFKMVIGVVLDGYRRQNSIEDGCVVLERMSLPPNPWAEPPVLKISGHIPHKDLDWVITQIAWGAAIRRADGPRTRQQATLTFMQYVDEDRVAFKRAAEISRDNDSKERKSKKNESSSKKNTSSQRHSYQVKEGDTLQSIASAQLGDYRLASKLADFNKIRSSANLKIGKRILIP